MAKKEDKKAAPVLNKKEAKKDALKGLKVTNPALYRAQKKLS